MSDRPHLPSVQSDAIREVSASTTGVLVATGARWAGAIDALDAARDAWRSSGARVLAGAPGAEQAAELEAVTGIETTTLVDLLAQLDGPAASRLADGVLVVHDAGRLGADTVRSVLDGAERAGAKVILLGEVRQLRGSRGGSVSAAG